jgi:hypothetical protein
MDLISHIFKNEIPQALTCDCVEHLTFDDQVSIGIASQYLELIMLLLVLTILINVVEHLNNLKVGVVFVCAIGVSHVLTRVVVVLVHCV